MELTGYRCWDPKRVFTVMNPDAEYVADELFLAVHSDYPLTLVDPNLANRRQADAMRHHLSATEFLEKFLDRNQHHVQAVVMGESGSGKSHFIKWLSLNILDQADRRVLVIPKAGMSLRRIVERLIEELPAAKQLPYRARLEAIGYDSADRAGMRQELCNNIAIAVERAACNDEMEEWLAKELPNLFYDPQLRVSLKGRHGVIEELVEHIFHGPEGYERLESQRLFQREDLPLQPKEMSTLSAPAEFVVRTMQGDAELVQAALDLINRNLSKAIAKSLNFTGTQLEELMLDIRRGLKAEGQSLILLIEDFARLQGIDGALLQALIEQASPSNGLCELRWAMAVTRGYYEQQVPATVQTRMQFVVDMDVPTGQVAGGITAEQVVGFASRYLNAARVTGEELSAWREARLGSDRAAPLPNRCAECALRETCHRTFGEVDGVGLYPFTGNAVLNMTRRMDANFADRFNPRVLVKDVMREILGNHEHEIAAGEFPSRGLLERMGGTKLSPVEREKLRTENPAQLDRRLAFVSLWSRRPEHRDALPDALYEAFQLTPPAPGLAVVALDETLSGGDHDGKEESGTKSANDALVAAVQEWGRGGTLQDKAVNDLRSLLKKALWAYFDWDQIGIQPGSVDFEQRSIGFVDQMTRYTPAAKGIRLSIPLDSASEDERLQASMALEGLVRFGEHGSWQFPDGATLLAAYAESVDSWAAHLIGQMQELPGGTAWDPVVAAVELLTIGNAMTGIPTVKDADLLDWVDALFQPGRAPNELLAADWVSLATELGKHRADLQSFVRARTAGTKGGAIGSFIDPTRICEAIKRVRRTWQATEAVPLAELEGRFGVYKALGKARKAVDKALGGAIQQEAERRRDLVTVVSAVLPDGMRWKDLVSDLAKLADQVNNVGVSGSQPLRNNLKELLVTVEKLAVEDALKEVVSLDEKARTNLAVLGRPRTSQVLHRASEAISLATRFLDDLQTGIAKDSAALGEDGDLLDSSKESIGQSLAALGTELTELGGEGNA